MDRALSLIRKGSGSKMIVTSWTSSEVTLRILGASRKTLQWHAISAKGPPVF